MLGAYSVPGSSFSAPQLRRDKAHVMPAVNFNVIPVFISYLFQKTSKIFFIHFRSPALLQEDSDGFFIQTTIGGQIYGHYVLVVGTAQIELARPFIRLHVADDKKREHHAKRRQQNRKFKCYG